MRRVVKVNRRRKKERRKEGSQGKLKTHKRNRELPCVGKCVGKKFMTDVHRVQVSECGPRTWAFVCSSCPRHRAGDLCSVVVVVVVVEAGRERESTSDPL